MDAFDADVLIYAATADHDLGRRIRRLFPDGPVSADAPLAGVGSVLLLPELLAKPIREEDDLATGALGALLGRLDLRPVDQATAQLAVALAASYRLKPLDATHLATAVHAGADRFLTNNRRDFVRSISEIDVTYPDDLPGPP